jgi:hypothetical protein
VYVCLADQPVSFVGRKSMLQKVLQFIQLVLQSFGRKTPSSSQPMQTLEKSDQPASTTSTPNSPMGDLGAKKPQNLEPDQEQKLLQLYPPFAELVRSFILEARAKNINVAIFEGLRTFDRQKELFFKGRNSYGTVVDRRLVVTNARPGESFHQYGLAVDIVFDADAVKPGWQWSWDDKYPWKALAELGKAKGLESAYFWKSFPEAPHFQLTYGARIIDLIMTYNKTGLAGVWEFLDQKQLDQRQNTTPV